MKQKHIEREWKQLLKRDEQFLSSGSRARSAGWQEKISGFVPEKLNDTLYAAFYKAFELIFEKGTGVIEKTCRKEKKEQNYKINEYTANVRNSRRSLRAFGREAGFASHVNTAFSAVEGVGMGLVGMGLPDIPVFLGIILKSIYEIALSYGFSYDSEEEQIFILKLIETALSRENALMEGNIRLNRWMERQAGFDCTRTEQMKSTSDALAKELLYLKFVQGIPIVGVVGGLSDMVYQKKISDYAALKYKRRFLLKYRRPL